MRQTLLLIPCIALSLISCSSIKPVGTVGPKKLGVYAIASSDFLSASRMIVVLDERGNVAAYSGGTVSGAGTVGLQTAGTLAGAGAIMYGAKAIKNGLQNSNVVATVKGVPSSVTVKGIPSDFDINVTGAIKRH